MGSNGNDYYEPDSSLMGYEFADWCRLGVHVSYFVPICASRATLLSTVFKLSGLITLLVA